MRTRKTYKETSFDGIMAFINKSFKQKPQAPMTLAKKKRVERVAKLHLRATQ